MSKNKLPAGAITGIGSVPFTYPHEAVQFVAEMCPDIPFAPQLPQRSTREQMIEQILDPLIETLHTTSRPVIRPHASGFGYDMLDIDGFLQYLIARTPALAPECAAGFFAFVQALERNAFPAAIALKGQMVGPLTLASQLHFNGKNLLEWEGSAPDAPIHAIAQTITRMAQWQIQQLQRFNKPILFFLDEPCVTLVAPDAAELHIVRNVVETLRIDGVLVGIHSCATPDTPVHAAAMCHTKPDILSFDAHHGIELFFAEREAQEFLHHGGIVAFGLVPTWNDLHGVDADALFARWSAASEGIMDKNTLAKQTMITAACGVGLLEKPAARQSFVLARAVGDRIFQMAR